MDTFKRRRDYSLPEILTGKKWIDGKPIYRRVFSGNIEASANSYVYTELISSTSFAAGSLINSGGWWQQGDVSVKRSINTVDFSSGSTMTQSSFVYINAGGGVQFKN
jgi:hypothetical protein